MSRQKRLKKVFFLQKLVAFKGRKVAFLIAFVAKTPNTGLGLN